MNILLRIVLSLVGIVALLALVAFADGATLPIDHSVSVTGTVAAPPPAVFARINDIANGAAWRPQVKSVKLLPKDNSRDAWIEDYGHGQEMQFLALTTAPPVPNLDHIPDQSVVVAKRVVRLNGPNASYGGTWTYELSETRTNDGYPGTLVKITEDGYINPPIYRFVMAHIMGATKNLNDYLKDLQTAFAK
jgi:hypothetical protein